MPRDPDCPQLLNPVPWNWITLTLRLIAHALGAAGVPAFLRQARDRSKNAIDRAIEAGVAEAIDELGDVLKAPESPGDPADAVSPPPSP